MKRQTSAVSPSSSRRENAPEKIHAKTIGCMSGILHLISRSNSRRQRRFLTFGNKKNPKNNSSSAVSSIAAVEISKEEKTSEVAAGRKSISPCEVPRSPTLPAEIRRSRATKPQSPTAESRSPALVARLMGLEEASEAAPSESVAEKRRQLLGALQRCDEDLKALKKIIEAVQLTDPLPSAEPEESKTAGEFDGKIKTVSEVKCTVVNGEQQQPSPVSVLDEFTRSPLSPSCHSGRHSFGRIQLQQKQQQLLKKPGEEEISSTYIYERMTSELVHKKVIEDEDHHSVMWSSKAMIKSVEEVCRDIAWGEKRELGRIGLALQDHICKDLIEEVVRELGCFYTLPFQACKRRLCF
ncbi:hypothetical protein HN51_016241 [Arachis hypogaea]|uniref:Uncharacterized protein LOC107494225 n=1 Tax=Arachis duranensis TaxID=130453 RepID=A0A6P4DMI8_ARADU|nr:uncharacterized protein LOC107494225 [Arachis duranensis]XP_025605478.1 uncharacterized protein LOC112696812 [Arachis hypogaea]QHO46754.1 uncharacterized protein DS421_6g190360 [Arachis hypogaea]